MKNQKTLTHFQKTLANSNMVELSPKHQKIINGGLIGHNNGNQQSDLIALSVNMLPLNESVTTSSISLDLGTLDLL